MQMMQGDGATKDNAAFEEAGKCTTEATMNVQTVASLGRETTFIQKYKTQDSVFDCFFRKIRNAENMESLLKLIKLTKTLKA